VVNGKVVKRWVIKNNMTVREEWTSGDEYGVGISEAESSG
jgi:hypothetical protein